MGSEPKGAFLFWLAPRGCSCCAHFASVNSRVSTPRDPDKYSVHEDLYDDDESHATLNPPSPSFVLASLPFLSPSCAPNFLRRREDSCRHS